MAGYTLYYFFSIIFAAGALFYIMNLVYLKTKGKAFYGIKLKPGTAEYKKAVSLASNRNLAIWIVLDLILIANLAYSVMLVIRLNTASAHFVLIFAPIFTAVLFSVAYFKTRDMLEGTDKHN